MFSGREGEKYSSLDYEVEESSTASMPLRRSKSKGELEQPAGYMPGMEAEGKKKRGIFKLFSRGKTSSFKLVGSHLLALDTQMLIISQALH